MSTQLTPITPGEVLLEEFLLPAGISRIQLAKAIGLPASRIGDIVRGKRAITRDTAARLAVFFGTSPDLWINLQARHDAKVTARDLMPAIAKRIRPHSPKAA